MSETAKETDDYNTDNYINLGVNAAQRRWGLAWVAPSTYTLNKIDVALMRGNAGYVPSGIITAYIYSVTSDKPVTLIQQADATIDSSILTAAPAWHSFTFSGVSIVSGSKYSIVFYNDIASPSGNYCTKVAIWTAAHGAWNFSGCISNDLVNWTQWSAYTARKRTWQTDVAAGTSVPVFASQYRRRWAG